MQKERGGFFKRFFKRYNEIDFNNHVELTKQEAWRKYTTALKSGDRSGVWYWTKIIHACSSVKHQYNIQLLRDRKDNQ